MNHVIPGSSALNTRRKSALLRLEKHLIDHKKSHDIKNISVDGVLVESDYWKNHDRDQRAEFEKLKSLIDN